MRGAHQPGNQSLLSVGHLVGHDRADRGEHHVDSDLQQGHCGQHRRAVGAPVEQGVSEDQQAEPGEDPRPSRAAAAAIAGPVAEGAEDEIGDARHRRSAQGRGAEQRDAVFGAGDRSHL